MHGSQPVFPSPNKRFVNMQKVELFTQIFIGETHVGGCDDLFALESAGTLEALLNA